MAKKKGILKQLKDKIVPPKEEEQEGEVTTGHIETKDIKDKDKEPEQPEQPQEQQITFGGEAAQMYNLGIQILEQLKILNAAITQKLEDKGEEEDATENQK